jgi:hypothetical protein
MPATSQKQRGFIYANFGAAWAQKHDYNNKGKLPRRAKPAARRAATRGRRR